MCVLCTARCFCTHLLLWSEEEEHPSKWEDHRGLCRWMLFPEVSDLDPALLSIVTGRQKVPQHDGNHHGNSLGCDWGVQCLPAVFIVSSIEAGQWPVLQGIEASSTCEAQAQAACGR